MLTVKFKAAVANYSKDEVKELPNFVAERFVRKGHADFVKNDGLKLQPQQKARPKNDG